MRKITILLIIFLVTPIASRAQNMQSGTIQLDDQAFYGFVKDKKTHEPIAGATIEALTKDKKTLKKQRTNVSGAFRVAYDDMNVAYIRITAIGYEDSVITLPILDNGFVFLREKPLL